jgi:hypothetical protein
MVLSSAIHYAHVAQRPGLRHPDPRNADQQAGENGALVMPHLHRGLTYAARSMQLLVDRYM